MEAHQASTNTAENFDFSAYAVTQFTDRDQFDKQAYQLPIESTNTTGTSFEHLNEDCLLEIFSVKSLTVMDLCSLAETCTLFQRIARRVFSKDLKVCLFDYGEDRFRSRNYSSCKQLGGNDAQRILNNFGSTLTGITTSKPSNAVLNLVAKYCVDSLARLKIDGGEGMEISEDVKKKLKPIFKRLQMLHLRDVDMVDDKIFFADFDSLIELRVRNYYVNKIAALVENTFPKLERFIYQGFPFPVHDMDRVVTFLLRHPRLKTLSLTRACCILQIIGNSCKKLEQLTFSMGCRNRCSLQPLQAMKSLKILDLRNVNCADLSFLADLRQLRELRLVYGVRPGDIGYFALFTQLTKLHIYGIFDLGASDVVKIIRRLTNLEELRVDWSLDERTFSRIVGVVKGRPQVLTLKCYFDFNWKNCDKNQKVRLSSFNCSKLLKL